MLVLQNPAPGTIEALGRFLPPGRQHGIGGEIAARVMEQAFDHLDAPVGRVFAKDVPLPYAANLEKLALPGPADIVAAVRAATYQEA